MCSTFKFSGLHYQGSIVAGYKGGLGSATVICRVTWVSVSGGKWLPKGSWDFVATVVIN